MGDYKISVKGTLVDVTEEQYLEYYRAKRRMRYFKHDLKTETAIRDRYGVVIGYAPSKEDSLDRPLDKGDDFDDERTDVEGSVVNRLMAEALRGALDKLVADERELVEGLFFSNGDRGMTERECAEKFGLSKTAIHARKEKVFTKLKNMLENNF
jgi:DNA-directed RNA polymerase specialized sigma24 family protein